MTQFDRDCKTIVMCHHGIRSLHLCQWLEAQGFTDVYNVSGGIDAYAVRVDTSLPRY
jgi:rhodanese-related sulfurtransferase